MQRGTRSFFGEDRIAASVIIIASLAYGWHARTIAGLGSDDAVGPGGLPTLLAVAGMGLGGWIFVKPDQDSQFESIRGPAWFYWIGFCVYAALIPWAGFGISTALFLSTIFIFLRAPAVQAVAIAVGVTLTLWFVFARLLDVRIILIPGIL